ncbi:MAG: hypothetical protein SO016_07210 [Lachnospiraceae bacterium]|nr:hypothetical protein [Robinsoniella sp.]MDY3766465.1 hypothetical protein [Lachnospiraceae bacterium]
MIDLLKADFYRLRRWGFFYLWVLLMAGADLFWEAVRRIVLKEKTTFLKLMISGTEQKILFVAVGILISLYLYQERESGFLRQTQPLYPKWKQIAEKMLFGALLSVFAEALCFGEHFAKVVYFHMTWDSMALIETEAFFIADVFVCTAFVGVSVCAMEWFHSVWGSAVVTVIFVWGLPGYVLFQKMLEVVGREQILQYGMRSTFLNFCQEISEGNFLRMIAISCVWIVGFGGFALLGRMRR